MATICLLTLGWLGILGMTWLFPSLARIFWSFTSSSPQGAHSTSDAVVTSGSRLRVAILIPAHNEESNLGRTLDSVTRAIQRCASDNAEFTVCVGADGCEDGTAALARARGVTVHEYAAQGKWRTLRSMTEAHPDADWVIFADSGIQWPEDFLLKALPWFFNPELLAVAPTYRVSDGGAVERILWSIERHFKSIEKGAGGPVSIHGATVAYRRLPLTDAFASLGDANWLNDDVVIPLTIRSRNPDGKIHYTTEIYSIDQLRASKGAGKPMRPVHEFKRRRRLVMGNIQWVRHAISSAASPVARILACRRIFRLFWAYWGLALAMGLAFRAFPIRTALGFTAFALILAVLFRARRGSGEPSAPDKLLDAAAASLLAPYYLMTYSNSERTAWK